jgi:hypothetical protein
MMWIAIQWAQVTAGVGFALLDQPERFVPHAIGKWLLALRDFLADSEFTLEIVNTYTVSLRRIHDHILMEDVLTGFYTDSEADGINRCCLYLQEEWIPSRYGRNAGARRSEDALLSRVDRSLAMDMRTRAD